MIFNSKFNVILHYYCLHYILYYKQKQKQKQKIGKSVLNLKLKAIYINILYK
jgi:hypothetical protein